MSAVTINRLLRKVQRPMSAQQYSRPMHDICLYILVITFYISTLCMAVVVLCVCVCVRKAVGRGDAWCHAYQSGYRATEPPTRIIPCVILFSTCRLDHGVGNCLSVGVHDSYQIEKVQRRAARFARKDYNRTTLVTQLTSKLG